MKCPLTFFILLLVSTGVTSRTTSVSKKKDSRIQIIQFPSESSEESSEPTQTSTSSTASKTSSTAKKTSSTTSKTSSTTSTTSPTASTTSSKASKTSSKASKTSSTASTTSSTAETSTSAGQDICTCGVFPSANRIVGGYDAIPHSLPYQVSLWRTFKLNKPYCGGTLISTNFVLTAAHCILDDNSDMIVALGDSIFDINDGEIWRDVIGSIIHPNHNNQTLEYDFALLKLETPVQVSPSIGIACLPNNPNNLFVGKKMTISGWGRIFFNGPQSTALKAGIVTVMTNEECDSLGYYDMILPSMICAASQSSTSLEFDTDACQGDSGGPMVMKIKSRVTLIGVTSFGQECALYPYAGVYARVTAALDFIYLYSDALSCQN